MALTRLKAETALVGTDLVSGRVGLLLWTHRAYEDDATVGALPALDPFLLAGLEAAGVTPADPDSIADADLEKVADADRRRFYDYAVLAAKEWALDRMLEVNERTGTQTQDHGDFRRQFAAELDAYRARLEAAYGTSGSLSAGTVGLNFGRADWGDDL